MLDGIRLFAQATRPRSVIPSPWSRLMQRERQSGGRIPWPRIPGEELVRDRENLLALLQSYRGWTYKAVTVIANRMAEIPFKLVTVGQKADGTEDRQAIPNHPLYELLGGGGGRRPNPLTTAYNLRKLTQIDLELTGNAFWFKVRDRLGLPRELWRLRPDRMNPILDRTTGLVAGWAWLAMGLTRAITFEAADVIHFLYPSPTGDPYLGVGPLRAADYAYDIDEAHKRYQRKFFEKGAQLSLVLSTEQDLEEGVAQEILDNFMERHSGLDNAWLPVILGGGLKATPISAVNKELEALGLMNFTRDDILSAFGVPATKIGLGEVINRATADALGVTFNRETIGPRLRNIETQIEADLLQHYPQPPAGLTLEIDFDNPVPEDREFELLETERLNNIGGLRKDEIRARHKLPPFGGDYGLAVERSAITELVNPETVDLAEEEETPPTPPPGAPPSVPPITEPAAEEEDEEPRGKSVVEVRVAPALAAPPGRRRIVRVIERDPKTLAPDVFAIEDAP